MGHKSKPNQPNYTLNCQGRLVDLSEAKVMGIININEDSFYGKSRKNSLDAILSTVDGMLKQGATFIDLGVMSSRPGAQLSSAQDEIDQLIPVIQSIRKLFPEALISIDTIHALVAQRCLDLGVHMINDISGGHLDEAMIPTVSRYSAPYIAMHMRGTPENMQKQTTYDNMLIDLIQYFQNISIRAKAFGLHDVIIDPGFGFAKTMEQNFYLLNNMEQLKPLQFPILTGLSRKSMIWKTLECTPEQALNGTSALHFAALERGANVLRVHDVAEAIECIKLHKALNHEEL